MGQQIAFLCRTVILCLKKHFKIAAVLKYTFQEIRQQVKTTVHLLIVTVICNYQSMLITVTT